jgi:predicted site-specific integrase-resolvase
LQECCFFDTDSYGETDGDTDSDSDESCETCETLGVEVVVLCDNEPKKFEEEFAEDVIVLVTSFSARLYGRRGGRKKKEKTR